MKQMGLALLQYSQDFDEHLPSSIHGNQSWRRLVQPYVKSGQLFVCPCNPNNKLTQEPATSEFPELKISYGGSWINDGSPGGTAGPRTLGALSRSDMPGVSLSAFVITSQCIVVGETLRNQSILEVTDITHLAPGDGGPASSSCGPADRDYSCLFSGHLTTSNFLFVDGHVKSMKPINTMNAASGATQPGNLWYKDGTGMTGAQYTNARKILGKAYGTE